MNHKNKTALITGGAIRVGKSLAIALGKEGYNIALHYNTSKTEAEKTAKEIIELGVECDIFYCDLNDPKTTRSLIKQVSSRFDTLNTLINSASIFEKCSLADTSEDIFDRHMNINFKAPLILSQEFAKHCDQGNIVNMLDTYITQYQDAYAAYLLSKKALFELTKMSAKSLAPNIRVNGICISSVLTSADWTDEDINQHSAKLPLEKRPSLNDITDGLLYLINNTATTGQSLFIDSGQHLTS